MRLRLLLILTGLLYTTDSFAQRDSTFFFKTELSTTNNGFSIIPAFTLGAPAAFLDMHMGNKRWSFHLSLQSHHQTEIPIIVGWPPAGIKFCNEHRNDQRH
jgi:hypothetical protein